MLLKDFREPLLSFELIYFRNSFFYITENSRSCRYKILGHVGPLGENLNFLSPLGSIKFQDFLSFLFILKLSYSKPFHNTLNYASAANIEEVIKFYNLGDKTDFSPGQDRSSYCCRCCIIPLSPTNRSILWELILRYLVIKGMLLKIRPGRAEHIRGGETCLIHPGSRESLFKHSTLMGQVLMLAPTLNICTFSCPMHTCAHTHTHLHHRA